MTPISKPLASVVQILIISGALAGLMTGAGADEGREGGRAVTLIHNVYELQNMSNDLNGSYRLANDIDASSTESWNDGKGFMTIGNASYYYWDNATGHFIFNSFNGTFDGDGYRITGLFSDWQVYPNCAGLFGSLGEFAMVSNLSLIDVSITGRGDAGGLAGTNVGTIFNCFCSGSITDSDYAIGGLVGWNGHSDNSKGIISRCSSDAQVFGGWPAGGLAGGNEGSIVNCYSTGSVHGAHVFEDQIGGLVGVNSYIGDIGNSYSLSYVGSGGGGLVGFNNATITGCYWDNVTSGNSSSAGGTGKNTTDMKKRATFEGWDFDTIWNITENETYPILRDNGGVPHPPANRSPTILTSPAAFAYVETPYSIWLLASDPDGDSLSWNMTSNASWLSMTGAGLLSGTPSSADPGTYIVAITVSDGRGGSASLTFELTVSAKPHTISWTDVPVDANLTEGDNYTFTAKAIDSYPEHILAYSVNSAGNTTLTVNSSTGAIAWYNVTAGTYQFTLSATDGELTISHDFVLSVAKKQEPFLAPHIVSVTGPENITVKASSVQTFSVEATSPSGANLTYEWKENGVTVSTNKTFSRKFAPGDHTLILLIGDGLYTTTRTFNFTVAPPPKTIVHRPVSVPGFEAGIAAAAIVTVVAIGLFWRRERR